MTGPRPPRPGPRRGPLRLRPVAPGAFELVHPPCVEERSDDYAEAMEIRRAGEPDEAREVLRFALEGCGDNLWVHAALGRIELEDLRDPNLARGHFGYAVELVQRALPPNFRDVLPPDRPANRPLYEAIDGLIACYEALRQPREADELRRWARALSGTSATTPDRP